MASPRTAGPGTTETPRVTVFVPSPILTARDNSSLILAGTLAAFVWEGATFALGFGLAGALGLFNIWAIAQIASRLINAAIADAEHGARPGVSAVQLGLGFTAKLLLLGLAFTGLILNFPALAVLAGFNAALATVIVRGIASSRAIAGQEA